MYTKLLKKDYTYLLYLLPSIFVLIAITILPTLYLFVTSFTPLDLARPGTDKIVGFLNYEELYYDDRFWNSLIVQLKITVYSVFFQVCIGFLIALLINTGLPYLDFIRTVFLIPMVLPPVVVAIIWKIIFTPNVSSFYRIMEYINLPQDPWLSDPIMALWAIIIADIWEWFPFTMLMFLAALQMIPDEPLEASKIDGANYIQTLYYIIIPSMKSIIIVATLFRVIDSIKAFPLIYIMTSGGPGVVTEATNYYAYLQGLTYSYIGYSSAISMVLLFITLCLSLFIVKYINQDNN